ncbi:uncharacterized protein N0V89_006181 [Didymosphaeria variabile]|uniref:AB hydrolase-1 domain-containing protein n=1 Tax=Didymosphaeria variabile TaxID=1932322 RepID=A0A9W9CC63_9PLEO|nr:uncharacterized protein N0V89_006181 [Didymosphaeria variabile]KAJ4354444.1 hypothetical protein N0V89_006181 [Didymosphaeria variabile]
MPSPKPTLVLVPGSFALPEFYANVVSAVKSAGYDIHMIHNLSTGLAANEGRPEGPHSMYEDAAQIAETISKLSDEGKDIVLFAHSYGGVPATQSLKGLSKEAREKEGKKGGVVRIAYMTCIVPAVGATAALGEVPEETRMGIDGYGLEIDEQGWMHHSDLARSARICYSDLPPEQGQAWMARFPAHAAISFGQELTYAGYNDVHVSWLLCEKDLCIPEYVQREAVARIEKSSGRKVDVTSIDADHIPVAPENPKEGEAINWFLETAAKA